MSPPHHTEAQDRITNLKAHHVLPFCTQATKWEDRGFQGSEELVSN